LLIVDAQLGVLRNTWDAPRVVENIGLAVEKARGQSVPVIWVQHVDEELVSGSPDWQIVPELSPAKGEMHIHKRFNSAFELTSLQETLARAWRKTYRFGWRRHELVHSGHGIQRAGAGYDLTLISDAHTTESMELDEWCENRGGGYRARIQRRHDMCELP
jgi:hypothetical protein